MGRVAAGLLSVMMFGPKERGRGSDALLQKGNFTDCENKTFMLQRWWAILVVVSDIPVVGARECIRASRSTQSSPNFSTRPFRGRAIQRSQQANNNPISG